MAKSESSISLSASDGNSSNNKPWESYHTVYTNAKAGIAQILIEFGVYCDLNFVPELQLTL